MLANGVDYSLELLKFHQIVSLVDVLELCGVFLLFLELFIALEVDLLLDEVLLLRKLLYSDVDRLLGLLYFLSVHVLLVGQAVQVLF